MQITNFPAFRASSAKCKVFSIANANHDKWQWLLLFFAWSIWLILYCYYRIFVALSEGSDCPLQVSMWWNDASPGRCWERLQPWRLMTPPHWPARMHIASVGVSKSCFLFSLALCSLLLLLIPALQSPPRQLEPPQPRPHAKSASAEQTHHADLPAGTASAGGTDMATGLSRSSEVIGAAARTDVHSPKRTVESGPRNTDQLELKDIFIAVKTTRKYHRSRLKLLIQTWVSQAKEQVSDAAGHAISFGEKWGVNILCYYAISSADILLGPVCFFCIACKIILIVQPQWCEEVVASYL